MIQETVILFRVQHLQKRTGRIPVDPAPDFVDFVNEYERVFRSDPFESLDDLSWKSSIIPRI